MFQETPFFWGAKGQKMTPEQVERQRELAALAAARAGDTSPVGHWSAGAARVVDALGGVLRDKRATKAEEAGMASADDYIANNDVLSSLIGSGGSGVGMGVPSSAQGMPPSRNEAMAANGGPTVSASNAMAGGGNRSAFIEQMMPHAMRVSEQTGLDPRLVIAQAAQETGWGKSAPGNNYFGIKSHGKAGGNNFATNEVVNGQTVRINDSFRGYRDMGDSANGYASFLQENPRYSEMLGAGDLDGQLAALGKSGYATDPNYANSVGSIARSIQVPDGFQPGAGTQYASAAPQQDNSSVIAALSGAMSDPWVAKKYGPVINALMGQQIKRGNMQYQQQLQQSDPLYQARLAQMQRPDPVDPFAGTQVINGQLIGMGDDGPEVLGDFNTPDPGYRQLSPEEAAQMGLPEGAYQVGPDNKISQIGGGGTRVSVENNMPGADKFAEEFAKGDAAALSTISESGLAAQRNMGRIEQLGSLLETAPSGLAGVAKQAAGEWGIATEGLDDLQAAQALISSLVPEQRQPGSGPMSDADLDLFKQSLPRVINQPGGNKLILDTMRGIAQYDAQGAEIVQRLRAGEIDRAQAFAALQSRANPLEGFKVPEAQGGGAPEGTQQAPAYLSEQDAENWDYYSAEEKAAILKTYPEAQQ